MAKGQATGRGGKQVVSRGAKAQATATFQERALKFLRETQAEMGKVVWPDRRKATLYTIVVIAMVAALGVLIWVLDLGLISGIGYFVK